MSNNGEHLDIRMTSHPKFICVIRATVEAAARALGFDDETCHGLGLSVNEAIANVIRHGYHGDTDRPIWIRIDSSANGAVGSGICIVLEDECGRVDLDKIKSRDLDDIRPGGLGVHIIREMMDSVEYSARENDEGLRLRMCKYLPETSGAKQKETT